MVIAFAGRRIDAPDATEERFPLRLAVSTGQQIRAWLEKSGATAIVSSAACGADLLALEAAEELGLRSRVVLPYDELEFRRSSVTDRAGDWGARFDRVMERVRQKHDLAVLGLLKGAKGVYTSTNRAVLAEAMQIALATGSHAEACVVWEGKSRGTGDVTAAFLQAACDAGLRVHEILPGRP